MSHKHSLMHFNGNMISGGRKSRITAYFDIDPDKQSLLSGEDDTDAAAQEAQEQAMEEEPQEPIIATEGYSPAIGDFSAPISSRKIQTDMGRTVDPNLLDPDEDPIFISGDEEEDGNDPYEGEYQTDSIFDDIGDIPSYYNEAALTAKERNALPDDAFGIPRIRAYPLTDKMHVMQAIRLFNHCKSKKDQELLAKNILKAADKFGVDVKVSKANKLYKYVPEEMHESADMPVTVAGFEKKEFERTEEDIIKEHMKTNSMVYNNIFYGVDYVKAVKALSRFPFLEFFYPNFTQVSFYAKLFSVCGGMAKPNNPDGIYSKLKIRPPICTDYTSTPLGWTPKSAIKDFDLYCQIEYTPLDNWFKVDLGNDLEHCLYCLRLYGIMGEVMMNPNFKFSLLSPNHQAVLLDWEQRVYYHYDLYLDAEPDSTAQLKEMQYLYDLFWSPNDSPYDDNVVDINIIAMLKHMASVNIITININEANQAGDLVSKEQCSAYLVKELGMPDDMFLLPTSLEYPIIDKTSIKMAMDMIAAIPQEKRKEYSTNLNRKYKEFGCAFAISVDHPYAPYADAAIIDNMTMILMEGGGDSAYADDGTSIQQNSLDTEKPWYKRIDYSGTVAQNLLDNKEIGPNTKKQQEPDYTEYESFE